MDNKRYLDTLLACGKLEIEQKDYEVLCNSILELDRFLKYFVNNKEDLENVVYNCAKLIDQSFFKDSFDIVCKVLDIYHKYKVKGLADLNRILESIKFVIDGWDDIEFALREFDKYRIIKLDYYFDTCFITYKGMEYSIVSNDCKDIDIYEHIYGKPVRYGCDAVTIENGVMKIYYDLKSIPTEYELLITYSKVG